MWLCEYLCIYQLMTGVHAGPSGGGQMAQYNESCPLSHWWKGREAARPPVTHSFPLAESWVPAS